MDDQLTAEKARALYNLLDNYIGYLNSNWNIGLRDLDLLLPADHYADQSIKGFISDRMDEINTFLSLVNTDK